MGVSGFLPIPKPSVPPGLASHLFSDRALEGGRRRESPNTLRLAHERHPLSAVLLGRRSNDLPPPIRGPTGCLRRRTASERGRRTIRVYTREHAAVGPWVPGGDAIRVTSPLFQS